LLTRLVETEIQPACERYGIGLVPYSPMGGGLLAGAGRRGGASKSRRDSDFAKRVGEKHLAAIDQFNALCQTLGHEPADLALAWVLSRPGVSAAIVGPRTLEQLEGSMRALALHLEPDTLERLDAIFPGYRPSPEAFAW
jgi:aryl-alcohol dehydrogenase-like predicted oxidoreductase